MKYTIDHLYALVEELVSEPIKGRLLGLLKSLPELANTPASGRVRYHHAYKGGLVDHIIETFRTTMDLARPATSPGSSVPVIRAEDALLVAVLHDIHKVQDASGNRYYVENFLKSGKQSDAEPYKHGEGYMKSAGLTLTGPGTRELDFVFSEAATKLQGGVQSLGLVYSLAPELYDLLNEDVRYAIRYHDGAYGHSKYDLQGKETPLMIIFHCADMLSSRADRNN